MARDPHAYYNLSATDLANLLRLAAETEHNFWVRYGMDDYVRHLVRLAGPGYELVLLREFDSADGTTAFCLSSRGHRIVHELRNAAAQYALRERAAAALLEPSR